MVLLAVLVLAAVMVGLSLWLFRPAAVLLAGLAWLVASFLTFFLGAVAGAVNVPAFYVLWPLAFGLAALALALILRGGPVWLPLSAAVAAVLLVLSLLAIPGSSPGFHGDIWMIAAWAAATLSVSLLGMRASQSSRLAD